MDGAEFSEDGQESMHESEKSSLLGKVVLWVGIVVAVPLVLLAVLAWTAVGMLCSAPYWVLVVATWALVLPVAFLEPSLDRTDGYGFGTHLLDPMLVIVLASAAYSCVVRGYDSRRADLNRRWRVLMLPLAVSVTLYMAVKLYAVSRDGEPWQVAWMWLCLTLSVILFTSAGRFWMDVSIPQLEEAEAALLQNYSQVEFKQSVVAGLGTVVVKESRDVGRGARAGAGLPSGHVESKPLLVLVHGYAAGNGFWMFVLKGLSTHFRVVCVEMYGCGRSKRLPFNAKDPEETERILVNAFEKWREAMGIETMILCGHSLGAILTSAYAMSHPYRLRKLVLLSPAGVGGIPPEGDGGGNSLMYKIYACWWTLGYGPTPFFRWCGPFGARIARVAAERRISWVPPTAKIREVDFFLFGRYIYQLLAQPSSGGKLIFPLLSPMLHAYRPMMESLSGAGRSGDSAGVGERGEQKRGITCPLSIIYGSPSQDWMPQRHGRALVERLTQQGVRARVYTVPEAGHTLIVDNPEDFVRIFLDAYFSAGVEDVEADGEQKTAAQRRP